VKADHFWLCTFLDATGKPCNRRTMYAAIENRRCSLHRKAPPKTGSIAAVSEDVAA
jgi:hypothetical protein